MSFGQNWSHNWVNRLSPNPMKIEKCRWLEFVWKPKNWQNTWKSMTSKVFSVDEQMELIFTSHHIYRTEVTEEVRRKSDNFGFFVQNPINGTYLQYIRNLHQFWYASDFTVETMRSTDVRREVHVSYCIVRYIRWWKCKPLVILSKKSIPKEMVIITNKNGLVDADMVNWWLENILLKHNNSFCKKFVLIYDSAWLHIIYIIY